MMTTRPNTLRDFDGMDDAPAVLARSALVLIDCQNTYRSGPLQLEGVEAALESAGRLLERARALGTPVVHIQQDGATGSLFDVRGTSGAIAEAVAPCADEIVIVKQYPNSFVDTALHEHLQRLGVSDLVLAGFMTHMCVSSTARGAFNLGYRPTVVASATATRALPGANDSVIPAALVHAASLAALRDLFAVVVEHVDALP